MPNLFFHLLWDRLLILASSQSSHLFKKLIEGLWLKSDLLLVMVEQPECKIYFAAASMATAALSTPATIAAFLKDPDFMEVAVQISA